MNANDLQRLIADLERIEMQIADPDALRLLAEAKSRLILVWHKAPALDIRHGMIFGPLDDPLVQEFLDEEEAGR
jgi:hypothetical protein